MTVEILISVLILFACVKSCASITALLYFAMGEPQSDGNNQSGMIFSRLGRYISSKYIAHQDHYKAWVERQFESLEESIEVQKKRAALYQKMPISIWKLGICVFCLNVWITAFVVSVVIYFDFVSFGSWYWDILAFLLSVGYSYTAIRKVYSS